MSGSRTLKKLRGGGKKKMKEKRWREGKKTKCEDEKREE